MKMYLSFFLFLSLSREEPWILLVDGRKEIDLEKCYKKRNDSSCL